MSVKHAMNIASHLYQSEPVQRCILGQCKAACCLYGVWLDEIEAQGLLDHTALIQPFITNGYQDPNDWFDGQTDHDPTSHSQHVVHSLVIDDEAHYGGTACVFLRDDHKCALQVAAVQHGLHPWRFKPFYCILHPLTLDESGQITLDETSALLAEPGSCLRPADHDIPLIETFEAELKYFLGEKQYLQIKQQISMLNKPD